MDIKEIIINRNKILFEKPSSNNYNCPRYINPEVAGTILNEMDIENDLETRKKFAEIMENFGLEIASNFQDVQKITKEDITHAINNIEFS